MARPKNRWVSTPHEHLTPVAATTTGEQKDTRPHPLDKTQLNKEVLEKRQAYGRAKRNEEGAGSKLGAWFGYFMARLNAWYPMRAFNLYSRRHGPLLAAGSAYTMFFSIAALLVAGFAILGLVISDNQELQDQIVETASEAVPGLIDTGDGGLAKPETLFRSTGWGLTLIISVATSLFTALNWINGIRSGMRAIFGLIPQIGMIVLVKLRDLGVLALLAVGLVLTTALGALSGAALDLILTWVGLDGSDVARWLTRITSLLVMLLLDMMFAWVLFRLASGIHMKRKALLISTFVAGLGATILRYFSSELLGSVTNNPVLAPFAVILGLFIWFYFLSQVFFYSTALGAVKTYDAQNNQDSEGMKKLKSHAARRGTAPVGPAHVK